jgi:DNA-binding CsgD family transcriptional regulator
VASLVAAVLTNQAIADRLYLSRHTVDSHLRHIFGKLGVRTRVKLTHMVFVHDPKAVNAVSTAEENVDHARNGAST